MKQSLITSQHAPCLTLFFAGWGMDETPFLPYRPQDSTSPKSDLIICYDYRDLCFDSSTLAGYREIHLIAWSMGVWAASQVMQHLTLPITQSIAINGTPYPIDDERGIPTAIFEGTLAGLNASSLLKFQRRMCMDGEAYKHFQTLAPRRPWEELKDELAAIGEQCCMLPAPSFAWERAIIGSNDRIFPPQAQQKAWEGICPTIEHGNQAHYDYNLFHQYLAE